MSGNNEAGGTGDAEFDAFETSGTVEVGDSNLASQKGEEDDAGDDKDKKPAPKRGAPKTKEAAKPADDEGDDDAGDDTGDDADAGEGDDDDEDEGEAKPKKPAREHQIERLKREKRELNRQLREARAGGNTDLIRRLENVEKGLPAGKTGDTQDAGTPSPDPTDAAKYPLGHLDDRYIEDKLEWLAEQKATKTADAVLQREQENERNRAATAQQEALLERVDELSAKGSDQFEDFQELVVDAGMRGDYDLGQSTFEAACEADHGPQILYDLSQDAKEARRVAKLSPYAQMKFVQERDAEIAKAKKGRTKPQAGEPPKNQPRGANSKTAINPATDNLKDFEKAWKLDEKSNT